MDKRLKLPFGELKGAHLLNILIDDEFLHGWDLAKATGQTMNEADEQMATQLLGRRTDARRSTSSVAPTVRHPMGPRSACPSQLRASTVSLDSSGGLPEGFVVAVVEKAHSARPRSREGHHRPRVPHRCLIESL